MPSVRSILNLDQWPDLVVGSNGFAAKRRVDIAPMAYEISINTPLRAEMIEKAVEFAGKADAGLTRDLFSLCNGVRVGATKFAVFGVLGQIDRTPDEVTGHPPLNINVPNIYGRPNGWPEDCLIVGSSNEAGLKLLHAITPVGRIIVARKDDVSSVLRDFGSVQSWLAAEVDRAIKVTDLLW
jgi:hypothetical protein